MSDTAGGVEDRVMEAPSQESMMSIKETGSSISSRTSCKMVAMQSCASSFGK